MTAALLVCLVAMACARSAAREAADASYTTATPATDFSAGRPGLAKIATLVRDPESESVQEAERAPRRERRHEFYFTRAIYTGWRRFRGPGSWATDFPKADRQFVYVLKRLMKHLDLYEGENAVRLDDPDLRRYPFLYALEVGYMNLTDAEVEGLRGYLEAGGFLVVDDFWGSLEWDNFEREMARVLPQRRIVDVPIDHPVFHQFYDIDEIVQVPNIGNAMRGGPTYERDGYVPRVRGILADDGRLMVVINWNTDLGDAWEWSERPEYPIEYSNFAYKLAVNFIIYGMTH